MVLYSRVQLQGTLIGCCTYLGVLPRQTLQCSAVQCSAVQCSAVQSICTCLGSCDFSLVFVSGASFLGCFWRLCLMLVL